MLVLEVVPVQVLVLERSYLCRYVGTRDSCTGVVVLVLQSSYLCSDDGIK